MRIWRFWFNSFVLASQYDPPGFIEFLMLTLAIPMLVISVISSESAYLVLVLSLVIGAASSILVREAIAPSRQTKAAQLSAILLLIISVYGFADLIKSLFFQ